MYLKGRIDTNIDKDFKNKKGFSKRNGGSKIFKYFTDIKIIGSVLLIIIGIFLLTTDSTKYYISLKGNNPMTIYKDSEYIEPGFVAEDSKNRNLENQVVINSNLDTKVIGKYKIVYKLKKVSITRDVEVVEKPIGHTILHLKGEKIIYLKKNEKYVEPGYIAIDTVDSSLTEKVEVTSNLDNNKEGFYQILYSVTNSSGLTVQSKRNIIVVEGNISLTIDNEDYTNDKVNILVNVYYNNFASLTLPNGEVIKETKYKYSVSKNGEYKFVAENSLGEKKEAIIKVNNIDLEKPSGTCSAIYNDKTTKIKIDAHDDIGISKYIVDGKEYNTKEIILNKKMNKVVVSLLDRANNKIDISCTMKEENHFPKMDDKAKVYSKSWPNIVVNTYDNYAYWLYLPKKMTANLPIIVFLPGKGERGDDYNNDTKIALQWGPLNEVINHGYIYQAIIIIPQVPSNDTVYGYIGSYVKLIDSIASKYQADTKNINVIGFSHGCYGTLNFIYYYPDYLSSAVLIGCGDDSGLTERASPFVKTPLWCFVGTGDGGRSLPGLVNRVNSAGGIAKYNKINGPHNIINDDYSILRDNKLNVIDWMLSYRKS